MKKLNLQKARVSIIGFIFMIFFNWLMCFIFAILTGPLGGIHLLCISQALGLLSVYLYGKNILEKIEDDN